MNTIIRVSVVSLVCNALLFFLKLFGGIFGHSKALISDAVHSASDVAASVVMLIGLKYSERAADEDHPYGHERLESVTAVLLAIIVFLTGIGIGWSGLQGILSASYKHTTLPSLLAIITVVLSILAKEGMFRYTKKYALSEKSDALMAGAWDNRSDALASLGGLAGIIGARMGFPVTDSLAAFVICLLILKSAVEIFRDAINKLVDKSCDRLMVREIADFISAQEGVVRLGDLKTRLFGNRIYADIVIEANPQLSLIEAHNIAERVHDHVEQRFPAIKHCTVHVDPANSK